MDDSDVANLPLHRYRPLESSLTVRILVLHPDTDFHARIRISIEHANREAIHFEETDTKGYEAVSYCWGDPAPTHSIICDETSVLKVTRNVDVMLRYLRKANNHRRIWIDAICLNQEDIEEKNVQVRLMGRIYQRATKVHVWLGEPDAADPKVRIFVALKAIVTLRLKEPVDYKIVRETMTRACDANPTGWIESLFSRQWFSRRWIIQECALNHHVIVRCGVRKMSWEWFVNAAGLLEKWPESLRQEALDGMHTVLAIHSSRTPLFSLSDLLRKFHTAECSLPEDRLFSLVGLGKDSGAVSVTYRRSWVETYTAFAAKCFNQDPVRTFEHLACFGPITGERCPSWVPNWRNRRQWSFSPDPTTKIESRMVKFIAALERRLQVKGCYVGVVEAQEAPHSSVKGHLAWMSERSAGPDHVVDERDHLANLLYACFWSLEEIHKRPMRSPNASEFSEAISGLMHLQGNPSSITMPLETTKKVRILLQDHSIFAISGFLTTYAIGPKDTRSGDLVLHPHLYHWSSFNSPGFIGPGRIFCGFVVRPPKEFAQKPTLHAKTTYDKTFNLRHQDESLWWHSEIVENCRFIGTCYLVTCDTRSSDVPIIVEIV